MYSLLLCSSVYAGAVWFHFTSARPRDGLASFAGRSLTSTSRPSFSLVLHRLPRTLVFPVLPPRLLSGSRFPRRTHLHLLVLPSDLWVAENWPKRSRKNRRESDLLSSFSSFSSSSAFSASSFFLFFARISYVCVQRAPTALRERDHLFSERPTDTSLITSGLDSCGCLKRAPGRDTGTVTPRLLTSFSRIPNLWVLFVVFSILILSGQRCTLQYDK